MFKKLKDKIAEEVKQSPSKLSATVSQIAQAVVSPSSSSVVEPSLATDNHFSISEDTEETPRNSPSKWGFTSVDLREATSPQPSGVGIHSRRSSTSSILSDASSLFPVYESPGNTFHLQSDLESASELDDSFSSHLPSTSKEQLVNVLRKTQQRYNKYKGRYADLARHYRELERENVKAKAILTESQDKALRRIAELKEQCLLEQRAKAHLEEILRNDLEEKDHLIMTLNTKIDLLKTSDSSDTSFNADNSTSNFTEVPAKSKIVVDLQATTNEDELENTGTLVDLTSNNVVNNLNIATSTSELEEVLREKVRKLEVLLAKCKDAIKIHKEKVKEFSAENQYLKTELAESKKSSSEQVQMLATNLKAAQDQISLLQKREEESALSLAETKRSIHSEMEVKEEQITHLRDTIHGINEQKQELSDKYSQLQSQVVEMKRLQELGITSENEKQIQELSRVKQEAVKLLQAETKKSMNELKDSMSVQINELELQIQTLTGTNKMMEAQIITMGNKVKDEENQNVALLNELKQLNDQAKQMESDCGALRDEARLFEMKSSDALLANAELQTKLDELCAINSNLTINSELCNAETTKRLESEIVELTKNNLEHENHSKQLIEQLELKLFEENAACAVKSKTIVEFEDKQAELAVTHTKLVDSNLQLKQQLDDIDKSKSEQLSELNRYVEMNDQLKHANKQLLESKTILESDILRVGANLKSAEETIIELNALREKESNECDLTLKTNEEMIEKNKITFQEQTEAISSLSEDNKKLKGSLQQKEKQIVKLNNKVKTLHADVTRLNDTVTGDISSIQNQLESERVKANAVINTLEEEKSLSSKRISTLQEEIEQEKAQAIAAISKLNELIKDERAKASELNNQHEEVVSNLQELKLENAKALATIGKLNEMIESERSEAISKQEQLENERCAAVNMLKEQQELASTSISSLNLEKLEAFATIGKLNEHIENERTTANAATSKQEQLQIEVTEANTVKNSLERQLELANTTISNLQEKVELEKATAIATIGKLNELLEEERTKVNAAIISQEQLENKNSAEINMLEEQKELANATICSLQKELELKELQATATIGRLNELIDSERTEAHARITKLQEIHFNCEKTISESSKLNVEHETKYEELVKSLECQKLVEEELNRRHSELLLAAENHRGLVTSELNQLQVREKELEHMLQTQTEELEKKTDKYVLLQKKFEEIEDLPKKIVYLNEELKQVYAQNTMLLEQIHNDVENQPDWSKAIEEAKSEVETITVEKRKLEENLETKVACEAEMSNIIQQLQNDKQQLQSQLVDMQSIEQRIDKQVVDINSLEQKLSEALQIIENKESEINDIQESHRHKIKQLARDFDDKLHNKEEEITKLYDDEKGIQEQAEGVLTKQLRNQIKSMKSDTRQLEETIDSLRERHHDEIKSKEFELSSVEEQMKEVRLTHETELREADKKWRQYMDRELEARDISHKEEVAALSKEWHWERKENLNSNESAQPQELENTSQVAVAAVESGTGSIELMHRQLMSVTQELKEVKRRHKLEAVELHRIMGSQLNGDGTTELEYLRNILFEYMMGRETTVLARVIAAVLKFDQEQTNKVIEKEEHKQSLLGQLGIF